MHSLLSLPRKELEEMQRDARASVSSRFSDEAFQQAFCEHWRAAAAGDADVC
jgi:hypothetical protein